MGKKIIIYILILLSLETAGQGVITPSWIKLDSSNNGISEAWGVDIDDDGNIYWAVSNNNLNQGLDINCYKFEFGGNPLWLSPLIYGGTGTQHAYICNASDTALYIGGRSCSGLVTTCDMLLLKIDKGTGKLIWDKTRNFAADGYDEIDGLEIKPDGIYCGGWSQELNSAIYRSDIGLWKLDFNGNTQWTNFLGADATAEHQDGHFVVDSNNIYAAGLWGGSGISNLYNGFSFLGKFDKSNGNLIDSTLFGYQSDSFNDIENALGMTTDGTYLYITGYTTLPNSNDWQIFIAKFDKNLNQIWYTDWGGNGSESARGIKVENDKIYIAGLTESSTIMTGGDRDAVMLILDTNGNILSYQTYGSIEKESFQDLAIRNQNIYLTGTIESTLSTKKSMLIAMENITNSVNGNDLLFNNNFIIYPNPAKGDAKVMFLQNNHQEGVLKVFDLKGTQLTERKFDGESHEVSIGLQYSGIFFVEVSFPGYRVTKKIMNKY